MPRSVTHVFHIAAVGNTIYKIKMFHLKLNVSSQIVAVEITIL